MSFALFFILVLGLIVTAGLTVAGIAIARAANGHRSAAVGNGAMRGAPVAVATIRDRRWTALHWGTKREARFDLLVEDDDGVQHECTAQDFVWYPRSPMQAQGDPLAPGKLVPVHFRPGSTTVAFADPNTPQAAYALRAFNERRGITEY